MTHETEMKVTSQRHLLVIFATFKSFVARIESVSKEFRQGFQRAFECYVQTLKYKINKKKRCRIRTGIRVPFGPTTKMQINKAGFV